MARGRGCGRAFFNRNPALNLWNEFFIRQPVRRQRQPAARMVRWAQAVEPPGGARQDNISCKMLCEAAIYETHRV